jgi:hypothetical protein
MRRALVGLVAAGALLAGAGSTAGAAGSLPKLATGAPFGGPRYLVRPHTIWYTGDNTGIIGRLPSGSPAVGQTPGFLHWKTWTRVQAVATGTLWGKNCVPNCAQSRFSRSSLTVTATKPRNGRFTTMTLRYSYHGKRVTDVRCDSNHGYFVLPPDWPRNNDCLASP